MHFGPKKIIEYETFKKESFAQCGEDLIVKYILDNLKVSKPSYLDIGAHHPLYLNNTALFYKAGSTGINIEPDPELFKKFKYTRSNDTNLNIGISDKEGQLDFYIMSTPTLNTFSKTEAENYAKEGDYTISKVEKITVTTLSSIIGNYCNGKFPDLTVDAEGIDEIIIKQIEFERNYPIVICIETISFSTSGKGVKNNKLINMLVNNGYLVYADTNINTIFVRKDIWER